MKGLSTVNSRARSLLTGVLGAGAMAVALTGCFIVDDDDDYYEDCDYNYDGYCDCEDTGTCNDCDYNDDGYCDCYDDGSCEVDSVGIDTGATLEAVPGEGTGIFVEYLGNGDWSVWTACDTEISGYTCIFDLYVSGEGLGFVDGFDLEGGDYVDDSSSTAQLHFETDYDFDAAEFSTFTDEPLYFEAYLDGAPETQFTFWTWGGEIYHDPPTNPVYFVP